jgi:hypothetical protein
MTSTDPLNNVTGVARNTIVAFTFSEATGSLDIQPYVEARGNGSSWYSILFRNNSNVYTDKCPGSRYGDFRDNLSL